ncbi:MAG: PD-(D/E)XK nuclease family protein [Bacteroidales bacterium]
MLTFLEQVAAYVGKKDNKKLHEICIITPNQRAGLFLKKHLAKTIQNASWAPDIMSMDEFIAQVNKLKIPESTSLLLEFYQTYKAIEKEKADELEEFLKWAPVVLKDFNDIDGHVENAEKLFNNILDIKRIETWNPEHKEPTEFQLKYLQFFKKLNIYHQKFRENLLEQKLAYHGLAYRIAAQDAQTVAIPWKKVIFAGFNALSDSEEKLISSLKKRGIAEQLWDADIYYINNPKNQNHEAGLSLRKHLKKQKNNNILFLENNFSIQPKNISIYGVAKSVNQVKLCANILKGLSAGQTNNPKTAIVLANENLLMPMINSLPKEIEKVNITMGYPLRKTSLYGLIVTVFQMHITTQRMGTAKPGSEPAFYYKDLLRFFGHPAIHLIWKSKGYNTLQYNNWIETINKSKNPFLRVFCEEEQQHNHNNGISNLYGFLFRNFATHPAGILDAIGQLTLLLHHSFKDHSSQTGISIEKSPWFTDFESIYDLKIMIRKLKKYFQENQLGWELRNFFMFFQSMSRESRISMLGQPLQGLQIMGMLETRNLDFENVIVLSANEDILPASKPGNSFIPFDVKTNYNIPVTKEKDAVYAYHFYRLLQRAKNIHIIYNTQTQDMGSSEKSRFITQLQMELPAYNPAIKIDSQIISLPSATNQTKSDISIEKTPEILQILEHVNEKGFSPSTLNHYIKCSLFFYFRHIAGISEVDTLEETIEANTLGSIVHEVLQDLYEEYFGGEKILDTDKLDQMRKKLPEITQGKFEKLYPGGDITTGKNLLMYKVALRYVENFLKFEKKFVEQEQKKNNLITYLSAEEELTAYINIPLGEKGKKIKIRGIADRIDQLGPNTRIIDYKTGKVDPASELKLTDWGKLTNEMKLGKTFQLLMYAYLYKKTTQSTNPVLPGIFSLRSIGKGLLSPSIIIDKQKNDIDEDTLEKFEAELKTLISEIFDAETPFTKTPDTENCRLCDFRITCNRQ